MRPAHSARTSARTRRHQAAAVLVATLAVALSLANARALDTSGGLPAAGASPPADAANPDPSLPPAPPGGAVAELMAHRRSGVVSAWLENGVRVHHMWFAPASGAVEPPRSAGRAALDRSPAPPRFVVTITIPGGAALESAPTLGLSQAAAEALGRARCRAADDSAIQRTLRDRAIEVKARAGLDSLLLQLIAHDPPPRPGQAPARADAAQLEAALQVGRLLLLAPIVEPADVDAAVAARARWRAKAAADPWPPVWDAITSRLLPDGDPRFRMLPPASTPPTVDSVQDWLDHLLQGTEPGGEPSAPHAPIEVAIVGAVRLDDSLRLAARYLGSLPPRARISPALHRAERFAARRQGPLAIIGESPNPPGARDAAATVALGFFGPEAIDLGEQRALMLASVALQDRLRSQLAPVVAAPPARATSAGSGGSGAEAAAEPETCVVRAVPGGAYPPGLGMVLAIATVDPARADDAREHIRRQIASLADTDLGDAEFDRTRDAYLQRLRGLIGQAAYWSEVLAGATYRGFRPDDLAAAEASVNALTPARVREVWSRYATPDRQVSVTLTPGR
jgi:hypothetical protein